MELIDIMLEGLGIRGYFRFLFLFVKNYKMIQNTYESFSKGNRKHSCIKILLALLNTIASTRVELINLEKGHYGYYRHSENKIVLNLNSIHNGTLSHEILHGVQHFLGYDFSDYISSSDDYEAYSSQQVEREASWIGTLMASEELPMRRYIRKQIKKGLAI